MKPAGQEVKIKCPDIACVGNYKGRLACYYNTQKRIWHCFRCGGTGKLDALLSAGITIPQQSNSSLIRDLMRDDDPITNREAKSRDSLHLEPLALINREAWDYVYNRLGDQFLSCLDYFWIPSGRLNSILIEFPDSDYYQIRNLRTKRYDNPTHIPKDVFKHLVEGRKYLFVVEGVFDAICSGNGVAVLGKLVNANRVNKVKEIIDMYPNMIPVAALDPEETQANEKLTLALLRSGCFSEVGVLNYAGFGLKDIGEMKRDGYIQLAPRVQLFTSELDFKMKTLELEEEDEHS